MDIQSINKYWSDFKLYFWIIFIVKVLGRGLAEVEGMGLVILVAQIIPVLFMMYIMGYYSYKFSGKKIAWLNSLLGAFWFGIIFIFIGYYSVNRLKNNAIKPILKEGETLKDYEIGDYGIPKKDIENYNKEFKEKIK